MIQTPLHFWETKTIHQARSPISFFTSSYFFICVAFSFVHSGLFYREIIPLCNPANPHFGHCERWTVASVSLPPFPSPTAIWQHRPRIFANSSLCIDIKKCFVPSLQTFWCCSLSFAFLSYQLFTQSLKLPIWILAPLKVASGWVLWCMWEQVKQWLHQRHAINYRRYEGLWANIGADENWSGKCKFLHHLIGLSGWLGPNSERNKGNWVGIFTTVVDYIHL